MQGRQEVGLATRHLTAFIEGNPVGTLLQDEKGLVYFHFNPGYDAPRCRSRFQSPPARTGKPKWFPPHGASSRQRGGSQGRGRNALVAPMYDVASGLAYEGMRRRGRLAAEIPGRPASVFDEHASVPGMDELRRQLEQPVVENCEATLSLL